MNTYEPHTVTGTRCALAENAERAAWRKHMDAVDNFYRMTKDKALATVGKTWAACQVAINNVNDCPEHPLLCEDCNGYGGKSENNPENGADLGDYLCPNCEGSGIA